MNKQTFKVEGMHCHSCDILIEKKLINLPEVQAVDASWQKQKVTIYFENEGPSLETINNLLKEDNYCLCDECELPKQEKNLNNNDLLISIITAGGIFGGFLLLNSLGISSFVNVTASSSLPAFFLFGLLAGVSTCAALTGGIVLSMSEQWQEGFAKNDSLTEKMKPHLLFNLGRLASYTLLGGVLGILGSKLQFSPTFNAFLVIAVSIFMILNGLRMMGFKSLKGFQLTLPKSLIHKTSDRKNFQGKYMPSIMGALTILLPCGFTITAESLALLSGDMIQGALIMSIFALGTLPGLLAIGFSAVKMGGSKGAAHFARIAGTLVLLFAAFNINAQFNVLGLPSLNNISAATNSPTQATGSTGSSTEGLPPIVDGKQLLKMQASSYGYSPNYLKIRAGIPVRWEITDTGTNGCTNAIISQGLFDGQIAINPGQVSAKEFTAPKQPGKYKFSCWMGMISGIIEVVDSKGASNTSNSGTVVASGAQGCGCGGGNGASCGGAK